MEVIGIAVVAAAVGIGSTFVDSLYALRAAIGLPLILVFLRFQYALLIAWVLTDQLVGSTLPMFNGQNLDTALTLPTLLLMFVMPLTQTFRRMPALAFMSVFLLWAFASIRISPFDTWSFLKFWTLIVDGVAAGVLTVNLLTTRRRLVGVVDTILLVSAFVALYGLFGYFTNQAASYDPTTGFRRLTSLYNIGVDAPPLALFLSMAVPLSLYRALTVHGFKRIGVLGLVLVFLLADGLTFTRTAYIALPLSIVTMGIFLPSRRMKVTLIGVTILSIFAAILLQVAGFIGIFDRFFNSDLLTVNNRIYLWHALLSRFDPTQLLGNGLQASTVLLAKLSTVNPRLIVTNSPGNLWIGVLYDHGIIGVVLLTLAFLVLAITLISGARKATGEHRVLFAMALAVLINMIIHNLDTQDFWDQAFGVYFWIISALPFANYWFQSARPRESESEVAGVAQETHDEQ